MGTPNKLILRGNISIFLGLILGVILFSVLAKQATDFDAGASGLGKNTTNIQTAFYDGHLVALVQSADYTDEDFRELVANAREQQAAGRKIVLWLGASQIHSINALTSKDQLAVIHANQNSSLAGEDYYYIQLAAPNANFNELLVFYLSFLNAGLVPDWLTIAVVFDDLKEEGIRQSIANMARTLPDTYFNIGGNGLANIQQAISTLLSQNILVSDELTPETTITPQKRLESWFDRSIGKIWPEYAEREGLLNWLITRWRITTVKMIFCFKKRPEVHVPPILAKWNMDALRSMTQIAKLKGSDVMLYQQPYKPGAKGVAADKVQYDSYHERLSQWCSEEGLYYLNLQTLVPDQYWGLTNHGMPDAFHFSGVGHQKLGTAIATFFKDLAD